MNYRLFLLALIAALTLFVSCDKESDLQPEPILDTIESKITIGLPETTDSVTTEELKLTDATSLTANSRSNSSLIYDAFRSVRAGGAHRIYISKVRMRPGYIYTCNIWTQVGDADLYMMGHNFYSNRLRIIKSSTKRGTAFEQVYGKRTDLTSQEDKLYFHVFGYKASRFRMQIYETKVTNTLNWKEGFEKYSVGQGAGFSSPYLTDISDNARYRVKVDQFNDIDHSGKAMKFNKRHQKIRVDLPNTRKGVYLLTWKLRNKKSSDGFSVKLNDIQGKAMTSMYYTPLKKVNTSIDGQLKVLAVPQDEWLFNTLLVDYNTNKISYFVRSLSSAEKSHIRVFKQNLPALGHLIFKNSFESTFYAARSSYGVDDIRFSKLK